MNKGEGFEGIIEGTLWGLLFHYNHYTKVWACFNNEDKENYFNGCEPKHIIGKGNTTEEAYHVYSFCNKKRNVVQN